MAIYDIDGHEIVIGETSSAPLQKIGSFYGDSLTEANFQYTKGENLKFRNS